MLKTITRTILAASLIFSTSVAADHHATGTNPKVLMQTSLGDLTVELYAEQAPKTVDNFLRYVKDGSYAGSVFHRVIRGFVAQGGGFAEGWQKLPTYPPVANESDNGLSNSTGTIAMARTQAPDSATRQFYFNLKDNRFLDGQPRKAGYTVFGRVVDGEEVLARIAAVPTASERGQGDVPTETIYLKQVTLLNSDK